MSVPTDLSKLSNVVKNDVVKKDVYDELVAKLVYDKNYMIKKWMVLILVSLF